MKVPSFALWIRWGVIWALVNGVILLLRLWFYPSSLSKSWTGIILGSLSAVLLLWVGTILIDLFLNIRSLRRAPPEGRHDILAWNRGLGIFVLKAKGDDAHKIDSERFYIWPNDAFRVIEGPDNLEPYVYVWGSSLIQKIEVNLPQKKE